MLHLFTTPVLDFGGTSNSPHHPHPGSDPRLILKFIPMEEDDEGATPLHNASCPETLLQLLNWGYDPNAQDGLGFTALHIVARRGCERSALHLLCHGAFADLKGGELDETPLCLAVRSGSCLLIKTLIVFGSDLNMANRNGDTPLHLLCTSKRPDKNDIQFVLSAAGAHRCPESKTSCTDGCKFNGTFNGNQPLNFPEFKSTNLMRDALNAYSLKKAVVDRHSHQSLNEEDSSGKSNVGGRVLCLDGGGIRGVVLTQMLFVIEQEFKIPIIELFDWIAGTSTGGVLALALACKKSPLEAQCIYMRLKDKVFVGGRPYSSSLMEEFLKREFGIETTMGNITHPKVMIMTALVDRMPVDLHIFRNYISPRTLIGDTEFCPQEHTTQHVWEAAKVTGAAPSYFRLENDKFVDGGLISNNPTLDALTEIQQYQTAMKSLGYIKQSENMLTAVLSLGTGVPRKNPSNSSILDQTWPSGIIDALTHLPQLASLAKLLIDQVTQSEGQVVERSRAWCSSIGVPFFRFSPPLVGDVKLDEKNDEKLIELLWHTRCYVIAKKDDILFELKEALLANPKSQ